jgi:hypothetical protein
MREGRVDNRSFELGRLFETSNVDWSVKFVSLLCLLWIAGRLEIFYFKLPLLSFTEISLFKDLSCGRVELSFCSSSE